MQQRWANQLSVETLVAGLAAKPGMFGCFLLPGMENGLAARAVVAALLPRRLPHEASRVAVGGLGDPVQDSGRPG